MCRLCVTETNLDQRKHNDFKACDLLVPSDRLRTDQNYSFFGALDVRVTGP